ncbi:MAG TPA: 4,5-DOPA dioxygenase extradiol [Steroidobacteraceae bacterium]|nr:4,5-DOPA dioxygenase extradiol [Steroidobacteraceae bacterium]
MPALPSLFIGHGSPMNTLEDNAYTAMWRALGRAMPRPRASLAISAHWYIGATAVTAMPRPRTIHDFYGFPEALFQFQYPAPGLPELAAEIVELARPTWIGLDQDQWGLDHGTWSVLAHLRPAADVPVVQLSLNVLKPVEYHVELGARLAALRERGVLILGSGNVVHNLRRVNWRNLDSGEDWAYRFDDAAAELMARRPADIASLSAHPDYALAVPTPDHFLPLLYIAGIAAASGEVARPLVRGCTLGSVSMTCYGVGIDGIEHAAGGAAAPVPGNVPADQTNQ